MKLLLGSEEAWILKLDRPDSSFSTTIWWAAECFGSCRFESLFSSRLCSKLHFRTQIHRESPNWSSPSLHIVSNFRHDPLLELPERGNRSFRPWQLDTGVGETFLQFPEGYDVKYSTYLPISDDCTSTYHIYDSQLILLLFSFLIEFDCVQPFAAQVEALAFFFPSFSRRHRSDQLFAMVVIVALISCGAGGTTTAHHSILRLSIAWHSCVSFSHSYTLL